MNNIDKLTLNYFSNSNNLTKIQKENENDIGIDIQELKIYRKRIQNYINNLIDQICFNKDFILNKNNKEIVFIINEIINNCKNNDLVEICQKEFQEIKSEKIENIEDLELNINDISGNIYENANKLLINNTKIIEKNDMKKFLKVVSINNNSINIKYPKKKIN